MDTDTETREQFHYRIGRIAFDAFVAGHEWTEAMSFDDVHEDTRRAYGIEAEAVYAEALRDAISRLESDRDTEGVSKHHAAITILFRLAEELGIELGDQP